MAHAGRTALFVFLLPGSSPSVYKAQNEGQSQATMDQRISAQPSDPTLTHCLLSPGLPLLIGSAHTCGEPAPLSL